MKTIKHKQATPETLEGCQFLFMGLDDLLGKLDNVDGYPVSRSNYRIDFLCDAIKKQGMLSPIMVVRAKGSTGKGETRYRLIDGMKRIYCAIENKISPIPVLVCDKISELDQASTLALNSIRFRPCGFPVLNFVYMLVNEYGIEVKQIAKSLMKSTKTIKNWLSTMKKFYEQIYPQFGVKEWNKFIEFTEKECFTVNKLTFCMTFANSPEQLEECLIGKIQLESPSDAKTIREIHDYMKEWKLDPIQMSDALSLYKAMKEWKIDPTQMSDALVIYKTINSNKEKMPEECKKWIDKATKEWIDKAMKGKLGDENGANEQ